MEGTLIEVYTPASTANLGPGFDCLAMALELRNVIRIATSDSYQGITISVTHGDMRNSVPVDDSNLLIRTAKEFSLRTGLPLPGMRFQVDQRIPVSRGLGSSAAAIVGGLVAANVVADCPLTDDELFEIAVELEGHPDNVAAALFGGLVISVAGARHEPTLQSYIKLDVPCELQVVLAIPDFELATKVAREALPARVSMEDAVYNASRVGMFIACLSERRFDLLSNAMEDALHQPYRSPLIPGFQDVVSAATRAGALGAALSGAGPSVLAFAEKGNAGPVAVAMGDAFRSHDIECKTIITKGTSDGVKYSRLPVKALPE